MTIAARDLLDAFDRLSGEERREVALEILKRIAWSEVDTPPLDDDMLAEIADESFREYDAREAADGPR